MCEKLRKHKPNENYIGIPVLRKQEYIEKFISRFKSLESHCFLNANVLDSHSDTQF